MAQQASVVTPERFQKGFTYKDYMAQVKVNKDRMEEYHNSFKLKREDIDSLSGLVKRPDGPAKMLLLAEDWCGDVVRELPVLSLLAGATGMDLRIFPRDQNLDIMKEFLNQGQFQSIPVAVFYTKAHKYIAHWIERSSQATRENGEVEHSIRAERPGITDQELGLERRTRTTARTPVWQQATVDELRDLLRQKVG